MNSSESQKGYSSVAFPRQEWLREPRHMVRLYIHRLYCLMNVSEENRSIQRVQEQPEETPDPLNHSRFPEH